MNFLLHRHFAVDELGAKEAGIGAMLPDLWRMAERRMRPRRDGADQSSTLEERGDSSEQDHVGAGVTRGVVHHLEADEWFHQTEVFRAGERALAQELLQVGAPKLVLLAHPAWEMCLDGALLERIDFDAYLLELRDDVRLVEPWLDSVADQFGAERLPNRTQFSARVRRLFDGLIDGQWITAYRSGAGLAQCVGGIRKRFGLPKWTAEQESGAACILEEASVRARVAVDQLVSKRGQHLARTEQS